MEIKDRKGCDGGERRGYADKEGRQKMDGKKVNMTFLIHRSF